MNLDCLWVGFTTSAILAYPIYRLLLLTKSRQTISQYAPSSHQAKQGTPTMGGLVILVGILGGILFSIFRRPEGAPVDPLYYSFLTLLVGFGLIGFIDDYVVPRMVKGKRGLGWLQKLAMQVILAGFAGSFLGLGPHLAVYILVVLFWSNAYNFADGMDLNAGLLLVGIAFGMAGMNFRGELSAVSTTAIIMIGASLPFLMLNAPPARVFMGDVGALPIGAIFGGMAYALMTNDQTHAINPPMVGVVAILGVVMIAELVPVPLQIFWVKVFKHKLFPYTPIHHAFERAGWPETRVVALFTLTQIVASLLALTIYGEIIGRVAP